jgi:hypothetical protein
MSVLLTLQQAVDVSEKIPFDRIVVLKRTGSTTIAEIASLPIGTATYTDVSGTINDEYSTQFLDSVNGVSSLPGSIYRALNPYKQNKEPDAPVAIILELDTAPTIPTVDFIAVYKRSYLANDYTRIALLPIGQQFYQDAEGSPGDVYHTTFVDTTNATESQPSKFIIANANSGLVIVSGRFEQLTGDASISFTEPKHDIDILLVLPKDSQGRTPTAQGQVIGRRSAKVFMERIKTDETGKVLNPEIDTGRWSVPLIPNNLIEPNNTYYEFCFRGHRFYKYINSSNGLSQNFAMLAEVNPRFK